MEEMKLLEVARALGGRLVRGNPDDAVPAVSTDSRTVSGGELFIALKGQKFDAHEFVAEAIAAGASGAVISKRLPAEDLRQSRWLIEADDTTAALASLAGTYRKRFSPVVLAVTGSNGKSTTKEMIGQLLSRRAPTLTAVQSFNNLFGVCFTLLNLAKRHEFVVLEMGTSAPGEIARLAEIARPGLGVVTNVSLTHLEGLSSLEGVARAKAELLEGVDPRGTAVLNADNAPCMDMARKFPGRVVTFGIDSDADVSATEVRASRGGWEFLVNRSYPAWLGTAARHDVQNALAAMAACFSVGVELGDLVAEVALFRPLPMRAEIITRDGIEFINDAYNANPASVTAVIRLLQERQVNGRRVLVLGDMRELGTRSRELHREVGAAVAEHPPDLLVTVGPEARAIAEVAGRAMPPDTVFSFENVEEAADDFGTLLRPGDTVLLKGSRAVRMEALLEAHGAVAVEITGPGQVLSQKGCYGARCGKCIREH